MNGSSPRTACAGNRNTGSRLLTSAASVLLFCLRLSRLIGNQREGEIKWDTFLSGGAGGQNVNQGRIRCTLALQLERHLNTGVVEEILDRMYRNIRYPAKRIREREIRILRTSSFTTRSIRSILMILPQSEKQWWVAETVRLKSVHTTIRRDDHRPPHQLYDL